MAFLLKALVVFVLGALLQTVCAHPPGLSSADIELSENQTLANLTFAMQDIEAFVDMDTDRDAEVTPTELEASKPAVAAWVAENLQIRIDNRPVKPDSAGSVEFDDKNNVKIRLPYISAHQSVGYDASFLNKMADGHKQYVTIKNAQGQSLSEKMLSKQGVSLLFAIAADGNQPAPAENHTFVEFLKLGVEHILTGYDHLLFLLSLLVVTHNFWPALKIITFFTLAHSFTLALASFNVIELPASFVEPAIAATIVYVALENLWRGDHPKGRHWLTFFFGLIHGFGFADVLREMNIGADGHIALPLFSFNLGVELGQIAVAAIVLPVIWWLHKKSAINPRVTPVCSVITGLAGVYWLIERALLS